MSGKKSKYIKKRQKSAASASRPGNTASASSSGKLGKADLRKDNRRRTSPSPLFDKNNVTEMIARIFLIAMAIVFPLVMGPEKYANITHFKNSAYYLIAALSFCSIIVVLIIRVLTTPADKIRLPEVQLSIPDIAVILYWCFLLISTLLSPYKDIALYGQGVRNDGFIIQTFYVATYFVISRLLRLRKFDLNIYCAGGAVVAGLVMLHFFGNDVLGTGFSKPNWESGLLFMGPMGNINLTSYFVTVALTLTAALYITGQTMDFDKYGAVTLGCFGLMLWAELNLNTDAGIVALGVALLAALPLMLTSMERLGRFLAVLSVALGVIAFDRLVVQTWILEEDFGAKGWLLIAGSAVCGVLSALVMLDILRAELSRRTLLIASLSLDGLAVVGLFVASFFAAESAKSGVLYEFGQMVFHGNFNDKFGHNRMFTWKRTLRLAGKKPLFGSGPDTFCKVFNENFGEESSAFFNNRNLDKAHNEYFQLLICSGITALSAFLTFIGGIIVKAFRRAESNPILVCCGAAVISYAVHAFFGYSLPINTPLMWVLLGLAGAAVRQDEAGARQ